MMARTLDQRHKAFYAKLVKLAEEARQLGIDLENAGQYDHDVVWISGKLQEAAYGKDGDDAICDGCLTDLDEDGCCETPGCEG